MIPRWVCWTIAAILSWGVWAVLSRALGDVVSGAQSQLLSTTGMLPFFAALLWANAHEVMKGPWESPRLRRGAALAFAAGIFSCLGNVAYYGLLSRGGEKAATVVPLTALYPVVTILLALVLLRERLHRLQWVGVALSLAAMYLLNVQGGQSQHGQEWLSPWLLAVMVPTVLWGITGFLQRVSTDGLSGEASTVWFLLAFLLAPAFLLWQEPLPDTISPRTGSLTFAIGLTLTFGNYAILAAFAEHGKAAVIAPLSGLYPLVSIPLALWWFEESINEREKLGILLSVAAVALLSFESKTNVDPGNPSELKP